MIRWYKPARIVEVGSGHSTRVSARACLLNEQEGSAPTELIAIEPYPEKLLQDGFPGLSELRKEFLQDVPLSLFEELKANDILFIDSSHVLKIGSDVHYLFHEVLPRLKAGVFVHFHDIFLPFEYPRDWVVEKHRFYTEQYILHAFLQYNSAFQVTWAGQYMFRTFPERVAQVFRMDTKGWGPGSFWIRRTEEIQRGGGA